MSKKTTKTANITLTSPLRYPGSKRRLVNYIRKTLLLNDLQPSLYVEPFAGGASVALQLIADNMVDQVILVDKDPWITSFWKTVFFDTDWLLGQVQTIDVNLETWYHYKRGQFDDVRGQAMAAFFLNRTSFSGILKQSGPLGGKTQQSKYPIDCRFPRETLVNRIKAISKYRDRVYAVWDCSWDGALMKIRRLQVDQVLPAKKVFYYLDPPFFEKAELLYRFYFQHDDHIALRDALLELRDPWLLSYDSVDQVEMLYGPALKKGTNGTHRRHVELHYSVGVMSKRNKVKEAIISNLQQLPDELTESQEERN